MTEADWETCAKPEALLAALGEARVLTPRKARLFESACVRRVWDLLADERSRRAVEVAEEFADGRRTEAELADAQGAAFDAQLGFGRARAAERPARMTAEFLSGEVPVQALQAVFFLCSPPSPDRTDAPGTPAAGQVVSAVHSRRIWSSEGQDAIVRQITRPHDQGGWDVGHFTTDEEVAQCGLLRDLFGPLLFCPVLLDPSWLTSTVLDLARQLYDSRDYSAMPILADALQDAGCSNEDVLSHCRDESLTHTRGCWSLDLILDRR